MNIRLLAKRNIQGNAQRYLAYFFSIVLSVSIFFIYASFIFHPDVVHANIPGGQLISRGLIAAEIVIIIFSVFFIAYSNAAFIQPRKKEFGLLTLLGMSKSQLRKLIYLEQTMVSLISILIGVGLGFLFSKLFLMAISWLLAVEQPISFVFVPEAFIYTIVGFILLFQLLSLFSLFRIGNAEVVDLLKDKQKPKKAPLVSKWLVALSAVCLSISYYLACTMSLNNSYRVLPIVFFVLIGTYFLFSQSIVALCSRLYQKKKSLYGGTNLITQTNLTFNIKDYSRLFFLTSIITAVILTAAGTLFIFSADLKKQGMDNIPQSIGWVENDASVYSVIEPSAVEKTLKEDGFKILYEVNMTGVPITHMLPHMRTGESRENRSLLISESDYNNAAALRKIEPAKLSGKEALYIFPYGGLDYQFVHKGEQKELHFGNGTIQVTMVGQRNQSIVAPIKAATTLMVVDDQLYHEITADVPLKEKVRVRGYEIKDWEESMETAAKIEKMSNNPDQNPLQTRAPIYQEMKQGSILILFIGLFVSLLFFIVQGSMMYLRVFTNLEDKKIQIYALHRLGLTKKEIRQILSAEIRILFFAPFLIGVIHAIVAYVALSNLLESNLFVYSSMVIATYFLFQLLYYQVTKKIYERAVINSIK
ncbi:ABC transporter permease [Peribacillus frigoritolerans]|jgi:putative ABC transport system permease protein|uniref:FtsX-like permease family protein n=1 Tax=Peribacillus frigoritolerans TaxID=450367 RepID=UPI00227DBBF3|nr:ABC transporter permease [Peribacillus frigoritolerans]MCY9003322.1 ABC transporter permease [Peribacillus frigoritolerans]MED4632309.1 ABC transporter permease [Peribacillus frigoritolerans]